MPFARLHFGGAKGTKVTRLRAGALWRAAGGVACAAALPLAAHSQSLYDRTENVPVSSRPHPDYDAIGLKIDDFNIYPRLSVSGTYDDNIFAAPTKTSGYIATLTPSIDFASDWSHNAVNFELKYERDQYLDHASESSNELSLNSTARLDVDRASAVNFTFDVARLTEPRTDPDSNFALEQPVRYDLGTTGVATYREFYRIRLDVEETNSYYSFFDSPLVGGGTFPENSRDENALNERVRLSYALNPNIAIFGQVTPNQSIFVHKPFNGLASYNSTGFQVLGGVNAQLTHLITVDAGVGILEQNYDDTRIAKVTGTAFNVDAQYFLTQLITLSAHANHSIQASGIPGTPASDIDSGSIVGDYELRRNIILSPNIGYARYRYPGTARVDDRYSAGLNATYLINRSLGLTFSYAYIEQSSNGFYGGYNFDDNRVSLTVTLQR